jgi:hypothetical protein
LEKEKKTSKLGANYPTQNNIKIQYNSLSLYTATRFGSPDQQSSRRCRIQKREYIERDRPLLTVFGIIKILFQKGIMKFSTNT